MTNTSTEKHEQTTPGPSRKDVGQMFDRIAHRYDSLNRILSMGLDVGWRDRTMNLLPEREGLRILDVASGTGDVALTLAKHKNVAEVVGTDISQGMLDLAEHKRVKQNIGSVRFENANGLDLSAYENKFDVATISFGIRNIPDTDRALVELHRTLKPGGRVLILEFAEPENPIFGPLYRQYRKHVLPRLGAWLSGDAHAYKYLDETIATFPYGEDFVQKMHQAGFVEPKANALTMGSVMLYVGDKR